MRILCNFISHKWAYLGTMKEGHGLYQCMRCQEVSIGFTREKYYKPYDEGFNYQTATLIKDLVPCSECGKKYDEKELQDITRLCNFCNPPF